MARFRSPAGDGRRRGAAMGESKKATDKESELRQQADFLRNLAFFHDFDDHELRQFLVVSKWFRVPKGALIIKEGAVERAFYILVRGEAEVTKRGRGKQATVLTTLQAGACFGEMALVGESKRTAGVVAKNEAFVLRVEPEIMHGSNVFLQLKFYKRFCETLVTRLDLANRRMTGEEVDVEATLRQALGAAVPAPDEAGSAVVADGKPRPAKRKAPSLPSMPDPQTKLSANKLRPRVRADRLRAINPAVNRELRRLLETGQIESDTRRFAELIALDPILSIRVLQVANSPIYRRVTSVSSIPHAMIIVGIKEMGRIVAVILDESEGAELFAGFGEVARWYWRHSVLVGKVAELLKDTIRFNPGADVYLAGLFHDLGIAALDQLCPAFYPQLTRPAPVFDELTQAERQYIGVDHGRAGGWLMEELGLGPLYLEVMRGHHQLDKVTAHQAVTALVGLADLFAAERESLPGVAAAAPDALLRSYGWVLLQEHHRPFMEVNVGQFVASFRLELDKVWRELTSGLPE